MNFHHSAITFINFISLLFLGVALLYLLLGKRKSAAKRYLAIFIGFFFAQALAVYLANGWVAYGWLFVPWQTALSLMSGPFLIQFIFTCSGEQGMLRHRVLLWLTTLTALMALLFVANHYIARAAGRNVLLLHTQPLSYLAFTSAVGIIFVVVRSAMRSASAEAQSLRSRLTTLLHPPNPTSWMLRDLALAFSLSLIPVTSSLLPLSSSNRILISGLGSLFVIAAILLVYLTHTHEAATLVVKVIGITFLITLSALSWFGVREIELVSRQYHAIRHNDVAQLRQAITAGVGWENHLPLDAQFIMLWEQMDDATVHHKLPQVVYQHENTPTNPPPIELLDFSALTNGATHYALPVNQSNAVMLNEIAYIFQTDGPAPGLWQVGFFESAELRTALNTLIIELQWIVIVISGVILGGLYLFLQLHLSHPIDSLVSGVNHVEQGILETTVPVIFADEIGHLTEAFNRMTATLLAERQTNERLTANLQDANQTLNTEINDRLRLEGLLIHTEKLRAMGQLTASLTHEINNPLQTVVGCLALASEKLASGEDPTKYLDVSRKELNRVAATMHRMTNMYASSTAQREMHDVNSLFEDIFLLTARRFEKQRIVLDWQPDPDLPLIAIEASQIQQVLLNLVLNSAESMPSGGTLSITTNTTVLPSGVIITVCDTGVGISAEELPRIFDPFFTTKTSGLGLGLAISQTILDQHGGNISVKSSEGIGTSFQIWLSHQPNANTSPTQAE